MIKTRIVDIAPKLMQGRRWIEFAASVASSIQRDHYFSSQDYTKRFLIHELNSLQKDSVVLFTENVHHDITGLIVLEPLPWDSAIYGFRMGKVSWLLANETVYQREYEIKKKMLLDMLNIAYDKNYRHLMFRVNAENYSSLHVAEASGFRSMDVQVTLACSLSTLSTTTPLSSNILPYSEKYLPFLKKLSAQSYQRSRLYVDLELPIETTNMLHEMWVENDCTGRAAGVWVAHDSDEPIGYIAVLLHPAQPEYGILQSGSIDLITIDPSARGYGVGMNLVNYAVNWFRDCVDRVTVKTQVVNYPALSMYQSVGFKIEKAEVTLHRTL